MTTRPTPAQIKALRIAAKLSQGEAAALVHASRRCWQNWEAEEGTGNHRPVDLNAWEKFEALANKAIAAFAQVTTTEAILKAAPQNWQQRAFDKEVKDNA